MRNLYEIVEITTRLEDFDKINRLIYSIEAAVSGNYYNVLELNFNIPNLVLLFVKATVNFLEPFIYIFKTFIYFVESSIYFLFYLFESSIYFLLYFLEPSIYLVEPFIYFLLYFAKLRRNKFTLTEKFFPYFSVVRVKYLTQNRKTSIDIFKR